MAAELQPVPVDELTGIVVPVVVTPEDFVGPEAHKHHPNFPKFRPELRNLGGKAVRCSQVELLPVHLHHESYKGSVHDVFKGAITLPVDRKSQCKHVALVLGGVIPRKAVDLKKDDPTETRRLSDKEHTFISSPWITNVEGAFRRNDQVKRQDFGRFFIDCALQKDVIDNATTVRQRNRFLNTENKTVQRELGNLMIYRSVEEAIRPAFDVYEKAKSEGMVDSSKPELMTAVRKVLPVDALHTFYTALRNALRVYSEQIPPSLQTEVDRVQYF